MSSVHAELARIRGYTCPSRIAQERVLEPAAVPDEPDIRAQGEQLQDRVMHLVLARRSPMTTMQVALELKVSSPCARKYLVLLAEEGRLLRDKRPGDKTDLWRVA